VFLGSGLLNTGQRNTLSLGNRRGWHVFLSTGQVGSGSNKFLDNFARAWCVRGGQGANPQ